MAFSHTFDSSRETLEHLAGDDPSATSRLGSIDMTQNAHGRVRVRFEDKMIFAEVYKTTDGPLEIHWMCPRCGPLNAKRMSRIPGSRKRIEFDPHVQTDDGGRLSVEAFECPWELESDGRRMEFGLGLCGLKIAIENNVARRA
jgi:hypothetical protein